MIDSAAVEALRVASQRSPGGHGRLLETLLPKVSGRTLSSST